MSNRNDRVALVTGSTSGIGAAIARRLVADGYRIVIHSKSSVARGEALADELGEAAIYYRADLALEDQIKPLIDRVEARFGRLDVLVNNAGLSEFIPHHDLKAATATTWRTLYGINVIAPWLLETAAESLLRRSSTQERPSCIVNISSHVGVRPKGASIPYAVSKAALNHMTQLLAKTLAPDIRVNAVAPGLVNTPMTASWDKAQALWRDHAPMGRAAEPADIADIVALLAQPAYLTGEIVIADGGLNLT